MSTYKPLEGVKVVELATVMAGPCCGRHLSDWGAEVIKIETAALDTYRAYPATMGIPNTQDCNPLFDNVNAGKRGLSINIKTPEGMEALHKLLATADVFLTNNRPKALAKNGLDYDTLKEKYPGLIMAQISSFGLKGPRCDEPGNDTTSFWVASGFTADMMVDGENCYPVYGSSGTGDFITGLGLAYAIVCALYKKKETGLGDYVVNSLYGQGLWCNSNYNIGCLPRYTWTMPKTRYTSAPGSAPYRCKDGEWIMCTIMNPDKQWPAFATSLGKPEWITPELGSTKAQRSNEIRGMLVKACEEIMLTKTSKEWDEIFTANGVVHDILAHFGDFENNEQAWANDYCFNYTYPNGHEALLIRPSMTSEKMGVPEFVPGPMTGEHTKEILAELGYTAEQIEGMLDTGAALWTDRASFGK